MNYKWCAVPACANTSIETPEKLFVCVPKNAKIRKKWFNLARKNPGNITDKSIVFFCEDHFDMEKDMANYSQYKMGLGQRITMVDGVLPSKFNCQQNHRKVMCDAGTSRPALDIQPTATMQEVAISEAHMRMDSHFVSVKVESMDSPDHLKRLDSGMTSDLYVDHQIKEEVVGSSEIHNANNQIKKSDLEVIAIKVEPDDDDDTVDPSTLVSTDLYEDHKVNEDMVIGPTVLQEPVLKCADNWANHILTEMEATKTSKRVRRQCRGCYNFNVGIYGSRVAKNKSAKVNTYCMQCRGFFCRTCFNGIHHGPSGAQDQKRYDKALAIPRRSQKDLRGAMLPAGPDDRPLPALAANKRAGEQTLHRGDGKQQKCKKTTKYSCNDCDKQFSDNGSLEVHMKLHNGEKSYRCLLCDSQYSLNRDLMKHISEVHVENGKYPCKICNKKIFSKATKLKTHLNIHFEQKFKCSFCDKEFQRKRDLKRHILIHDGLKPHSCKICNEQFLRKSYLTKHERIIHNGVKPFSCEVCKKDFTAYTSLYVHMRVHSGIKPFSCPVCQKKFRQKTHVTRHLKLHENNPDIDPVFLPPLPAVRHEMDIEKVCNPDTTSYTEVPVVNLPK